MLSLEALAAGSSCVLGGLALVGAAVAGLSPPLAAPALLCFRASSLKMMISSTATASATSQNTRRVLPRSLSPPIGVSPNGVDVRCSRAALEGRSRSGAGAAGAGIGAAGLSMTGAGEASTAGAGAATARGG